MIFDCDLFFTLENFTSSRKEINTLYAGEAGEKEAIEKKICYWSSKIVSSFSLNFKILEKLEHAFFLHTISNVSLHTLFKTWHSSKYYFHKNSIGKISTR